ncbi:MAG: tyrosine-type recombinase/integrase [Deltaproteobacteria bacterium]|nr:tyrosine-type recombinase/integrase [Deltaproteobacteria bacterium]
MRFFQPVLGSLLAIVLSTVSAALKKVSRPRWESLVKKLNNSDGFTRGKGAGWGEVSPYNVFKTTHPEIGSDIGSPSDLMPTRRNMISLPAWAKEISPFLANQLSDHTRRAYEKDLKQFFEFISARNLLEKFAELRAEHIILFRKALEEGRVTGTPLAKATINRKLAVVKSFMQWLRLNRLVTENPAQLVKGYPQNQESSLLGLSDEEAKKILDQTRTNSPSQVLHCAILHVLLYLGLRKAELIGLKIGDWGNERGVDVLKVRGKGHRIRVLPLTERLGLVLATYLKVTGRSRENTDQPLFIPTKNPRGTGLLKTLNPQAITYIVARYAKKAGVMKKISPHSCRATCISNALDRKASHRSVQHLAGWSTPLMIQRYDKRREDLKNSAAYAIDYGESGAVQTPAGVT